MKNIIRTLVFGVSLAILDAALLSILKVIKIIDGAQFAELLKQTLSVIGIVVLAGVVVSLILKLVKSE